MQQVKVAKIYHIERIFKFAAGIVMIMMFTLALNQSASSQSVNSVRIIVFNKNGQKEIVKSGENISIVYGPSIKPEYSYIAYSNGKERGEYVIELKSNEFLLREISSLRKSKDSLKSVATKPSETVHDTVIIEHEIPVNPNYENYTDNLLTTFTDSLIKQSADREKMDFMSRISNIRSPETADSLLIKSNLKAIEVNDIEFDRNADRINALMKAIDESRSTGKGIEKLNDYFIEIDSLKARNLEIELINRNLRHNNVILSADLRARNAEYQSLVRLLYLITTIALLVILIALFIFMSYRQKKKFNEELNRINGELERINNHLKISNADKERLLKLIRKELDNAARYVISLLPKPIKEGMIHTDWVYIPSQQLGGDTFGYNWINDDTFAMYLLDVSGHGVGSSLHSVQVSNILRNRTLPNIDFTSPSEVLTAINSIFNMNEYSGLFFTIFYATYNKRSGVFKYSSAGHPPVIISNGNGFKSLEAKDIFIGALKDMEYQCDEIKIGADTELFVFSDGVFEFQKEDGAMYTNIDFMNDLIKFRSHKDFRLRKLYDNAKEISRQNELDDDFSILHIKFK